MSKIDSTNYYEVLGVERTADERTVKKAYFALVRRYPPETHPEEFKKLREAYEVLSDADARAEYDSIGQYDQHGEAVGEQIRLATLAIEQQRYSDAQVILAKLINEKPELDFARDLLGMAYLHDKKPQTASEIFDELVQKHPNNAAYHLHRGYSWHAQKQYATAMEAYQRSFDLDKEDVRPLVSLSDCYMDQKRWDDAVRVLDQAIHLDGSVDFRDFALFVRKLEVEIERANRAAVTKVLEELIPIIPDDPAAKRFVANRLGTLAAPLFAMKRIDEANLLMREAAKLDPNRGTGQMPNQFELEIDALPDTAKKWLEEQNRTHSWSKVKNSPYALAVFLLLLGLAGLWLPLMVLLGERRPMGGEGLFVFWMVMAGCGLLSVWAIRRIVAAAKSPYGAYTIVHPLYLLQVKIDKLIGWPLANLHDVRVTHRHTNGVYTTSSIDLVFNRRTFTINIYGQDASVDWANAVLKKRRRVLELMYSGMAEDEGEVLVPASLIPEEGKPAKLSARGEEAKRRGRVWYGGAAGAATLLSVAVIPFNAAKADHAAWDDARSAYSHKIESFQNYLTEFPSGRHVVEAKAAIAKVYNDAEARVREHQDSELGPAMLDVIQVLREKQLSAVAVKYESTTLFDKLDLDELPAELKGTIIDPKLAFGTRQNEQRESRITGTLGTAFDKILGAGVLTVTERPQEKPPVSFIIRYEVALTGSIYESVKRAGVPTNGDKRFLGIGFLWTFDVLFEGDEKPRYSFELDSEPAKDIRWTSYGYGGYESPTLPYDKMAESAFEDFEHQLGVAFGIATAKPRYDDEEAMDDERPPAPPPPRKPAPKKPGKKR